MEEFSEYSRIASQNDDVTSTESEDDRRNVKMKMETKRPALGFYINKCGFPITENVWERMWDHIKTIHPDGESICGKIRGNIVLPKIPYPTLPCFTHTMDVQTKLDLIQAYLSELQYNHTGTQFFEIKKNRPISGLMECAKEIIKESLPIKCLEATILGIYLTNNITTLQRFTIGFKTRIGTSSFSHVVLGIYYNNKFGTLGLSRRNDLMYKAAKYRTLYDLINDFNDCYAKYSHVLKKVKLSSPIVHDLYNYERIQWRYLIINMQKMDKKQKFKILEKYTRDLKRNSTAGYS